MFCIGQAGTNLLFLWHGIVRCLGIVPIGLHRIDLFPTYMYQYFLNNREHYRSLVVLGVPIIIGQLGAIITGLADTIMVGQHSTAELAAASFVNNVINAFIILGTGFSYNLTPLIGENLAKNKCIAIGGWLKNSLVANFTTTLFIVSVLLLLYFNLDILQQPKELMPLIRPYFLITLSSIVFVMLANSFRQFVEGIAHPMVSMWVLLVGNLFNVIGNYILIYGQFGAPEMGLLGAGISTLISRMLILLLFVAVFMRRTAYAPYRKGIAAIRINRMSWRQLNAIGWPIGVQQGLEAGTFCVTAIMIGWLGSLSLAAHQVAITISLISFTVYLGLGSAVAIRTSYYRGCGDWFLVRKIAVAGVHLALVIVALVCLFLFVTRDFLGLVFTDDVAVNDIVKLVLPILMLYQVGDSIQIVLTNSLRGLADVTVIMCISFLAYFMIAVPSGYFFGFVLHWGITGVWLAYPIGFACSVCLLGLRMRWQVHRHLEQGK